MHQKGFAHLGVVAVFLLIAAVGIGTYLVQQRTNILPKAQESSNGSEVQYIHDEEVVSEYKLAQSQDSTGVPAAQQIISTLTPSSLPDEQKPNIIFFVTDDQNFRHLSIAGNTVLKTPNIDSLAHPGVYFNNAYVPFGSCAPSRASIWTGKLPEVHGVKYNGLILPED